MSPAGNRELVVEGRGHRRNSHRVVSTSTVATGSFTTVPDSASDGQDGIMSRRTKELGGGELEAAAMDVVWERGGWVSVSEVRTALTKDRPLSYNTVLTIMVRLFEKGRLERRKDGRAYLYQPVQSRERYTASRMEQILDTTADRPAALASFVDSLGESDRRQLRRMLDRLGGPR
jgi:predicted transcriptional regulator